MDILDLVKSAIEYISENSKCLGISKIVTADQVKGSRQECECENFDHEFVDQWNYWEDDYYGTVYLPLPNGEYMALDYTS